MKIKKSCPFCRTPGIFEAKVVVQERVVFPLSLQTEISHLRYQYHKYKWCFEGMERTKEELVRIAKQYGINPAYKNKRELILLLSNVTVNAHARSHYN
jgi:hypothetical protein